MAGITQSDAQTILDALIALSLNFTLNTDVEIVGRKVKFRSMDELKDSIKFYNDLVQELDAAGGRTRRRMRGATPA